MQGGHSCVDGQGWEVRLMNVKHRLFVCSGGFFEVFISGFGFKYVFALILLLSSLLIALYASRLSAFAIHRRMPSPLHGLGSIFRPNPTRIRKFEPRTPLTPISIPSSTSPLRCIMGDDQRRRRYLPLLLFPSPLLPTFVTRPSMFASPNLHISLYSLVVGFNLSDTCTHVVNRIACCYPEAY